VVNRDAAVISLRKILFPVDFSDRRRGAAHAARAVAARFRAEVTSLHVVEHCVSDAGASRSDRALPLMDQLIAQDLYRCKVNPCLTTA
jgi:nucleotide-binding universal stress UspA family protein